MGCSAGKNVTVEPLLDNLSNGDGPKNGHVPTNIDRKNSVIVSPRDEPPIESEEPPAELLDTAKVNNLQKKGSGLSFELSFEDDTDDSIIKKHPPKRLQMLDNRPSSPVTIEKLKEKLEEAETRRQQILSQRVQSAKQRNEMRKNFEEFDENQHYDGYEHQQL